MRVRVVDLGLIRYAECAAFQAEMLERVADGLEPSTLVLVEHEPVLTLGSNFHDSNLLLPRADYADRGIAIEATNRGGDVTYHGPGQLVIYPIFNLAEVGKDLHRWLRSLESTVLEVLAEVGVEGERLPPHTGIWAKGGKVAAIGIKVRRWVSMHGIALNCNNDMAPFEWIVPCGIEGRGVVSMTELLGRSFSVEEAKPLVAKAFARQFRADLDFASAEAVRAASCL